MAAMTFTGRITVPVLCDGAIARCLRAKGVFINRCYDELNLSLFDLICSNSPRLPAGRGTKSSKLTPSGRMPFGPSGNSIADKVRDINQVWSQKARKKPPRA